MMGKGSGKNQCCPIQTLVHPAPPSVHHYTPRASLCRSWRPGMSGCGTSCQGSPTPTILTPCASSWSCRTVSGWTGASPRTIVPRSEQYAGQQAILSVLGNAIESRLGMWNSLCCAGCRLFNFVFLTSVSQHVERRSPFVSHGMFNVNALFVFAAPVPLRVYGGARRLPDHHQLTPADGVALHVHWTGTYLILYIRQGT